MSQAPERPQVVTPKNAKVLFSELLPHELMQRVDEKPIAVIPIGSIEYHGPQCAGHVDTSQAEIPCWNAVDDFGGVCVNSVCWGGRAGHALFPTSLLVRTSVVRDLLIDIIENLRRHGFRAILGVTGHAADAHMAALQEVSETYQDDPHIEVAMVTLGKVIRSQGLEEEFDIERGAWDHGGANETSNILASACHRGDLGQLPAADAELPFVALEGINPHLATPEYGQRVLAAATKAITLEMAEVLARGLAKPQPERIPATLEVAFTQESMERANRCNHKNLLLLVNNGIQKRVDIVPDQSVYKIDGLWAGQWGVLVWGLMRQDGQLHGISSLYQEPTLEPGDNHLQF